MRRRKRNERLTYWKRGRGKGKNIRQARDRDAKWGWSLSMELEENRRRSNQREAVKREDVEDAKQRRKKRVRKEGRKEGILEGGFTAGSQVVAGYGRTISTWPIPPFVFFSFFHHVHLILSTLPSFVPSESRGKAGAERNETRFSLIRSTSYLSCIYAHSAAALSRGLSFSREKERERRREREREGERKKEREREKEGFLLLRRSFRDLLSLSFSFPRYSRTLSPLLSPFLSLQPSNSGEVKVPPSSSNSISSLVRPSLTFSLVRSRSIFLSV